MAETFDNSLFPEMATPEAAARALTVWYGDRAADAAVSAVFAARADRRTQDERFWRAVLACLRTDRPAI